MSAVLTMIIEIHKTIESKKPTDCNNNVCHKNGIMLWTEFVRYEDNDQEFRVLDKGNHFQPYYRQKSIKDDLANGVVAKKKVA